MPTANYLPFILTVILLFLISLPARGDDSLLAAINMALNNDEGIIRNARHDLRMAEENYRASLAAYKFQSDLNLNLSHFENRTSTDESISRYASTDGYSDLSANYRFPFFWGSFINLRGGVNLRRRDSSSSGESYSSNPNLSLTWTQPLSGAGIKSGHSVLVRARVNYELAKLNYEQIKEEVIFKVINDYYQLVKADYALESARNQLKLTENLMQFSQLKFSTGDIAELDLMQIKIQRAEDESGLIRAEKAQKTALSNLNKLVGDNDGIELSLNERQLPISMETIKYLFPQDILEVAYNNRIDLKRFQISLELARLSMEESLSRSGSTLNLNSNYRRSSSRESGFGEVLGSFPDEEWMIQASVNFNLLDGGMYKANIETARINLEKAEENLEEARERIKDEIKEILDNIATDGRRIETLKAGLEIAEKTARISRLKYEEGVATSDDVLRSQVSLARAQDNLNEAQINQIINTARLVKGMGRLVAEYEKTD